MKSDGPTTERHGLPELAIATVVLIWSTTWIAMKDALSFIEPLAFMTSRFVVITLLAVAVFMLRRDRNKGIGIAPADRPRLVAGAVTGYATYQLCSVFALDRSSVFTISLLIALVPLFTMVMMAMRGEALPPYGPIGLVIAVAGTVIFLLDKREAGDTFSGAVLSLGAAVSFAAYGLINRPLVSRYPSDLLSAWQLALGTVPMLVIGLPSTVRQDWDEVTLRVWLGFVFVVIFPVYVAYQLWNFAIARRGAAVASSYGLLVPILSAVMAAVAFDETITAVKVAGAAIAILGLLLIRMPASFRSRFSFGR